MCPSPGYVVNVLCDPPLKAPERRRFVSLFSRVRARGVRLFLVCELRLCLRSGMRSMTSPLAVRARFSTLSTISCVWPDFTFFSTRATGKSLFPGKLVQFQRLSSGRWVTVNPQDGAVRQIGSQSVTPPGPANFILNSGGSTNPANNAGIAPLTAQINVAIATDATHNYIRDRPPGGVPAINQVFPANTGVAGTCNAFFNGSSINFYNAGGGCANTGYNSVVSHEYGHFVVASRGLAQNGSLSFAVGMTLE